MYEVSSVCTKKICSRNFTQFLQFSIIFNIRILCMDNDFSVIYLSIHNILQKHFHMTSSGLHHHVFFIRLIFRILFNASDRTFHNFLKFFIGKWFHQIMKCCNIKCLKNILLHSSYKYQYHSFIFLT